MKNKLPVFLATPRSRSTALLSLAAPYTEAALRMHSLGYQTEFFQEFSSRYYQKDELLDSTKLMEYFPLNRQNAPITHHFVAPPIYGNKMQRDSHKLQVLNQERKAGREYLIKIMSSDLRRPDSLEKFNKSIIDFFSENTFVVTRRRDVKGLAFSLLVSYHTNLWHKRASNESKYQDLYDNPITINPELCTVISESLNMVAMMDKVEAHLEASGYSYHTFFYEDMITLEDMKDSLDLVFGNKIWREYLSDAYIERAIPRPLELDYEKVIENYDKLEKRVDMMIRDIFE